MMRDGHLPATARARGLLAHLPARRELEALAALDAPALARALSRRAREAEPPSWSAVVGTPEAPTRAPSRHALEVLRRWLPDGHPTLEVVEAEADRRSLRSLLRGAAGGLSADERRAATTPTRLLSERVIAELAAEATPRAVAARLHALGHPAAAALLRPVAAAEPELVRIEQALAAGAAERATRAARRADAALRAFVAFRIDAANAATALVLAGAPRDDDPAARFLEGGSSLGRSAFAAAARAPDRAAASALLVRRVADAPLRALLRAAAAAPARLDALALQAEMRQARRLARLDPLSTAPLLYFLLRVTASSRDLRHLVHGVSLLAPPSALRAGLVTPWS